LYGPIQEVEDPKVPDTALEVVLPFWQSFENIGQSGFADSKERRCNSTG
jgi:hypothetical protein